MYKDNFLYEIETKDFYKYVVEDVQLKYDTSSYSSDDNRPLTIAKNKKVVVMMKKKISGKIMEESVASSDQTYAYRKLDN